MFITKKYQDIDNSGFTLLEVLLVVVIIGIIAAIAAPTWFKFIQNQRLNVSQNQAYLAIQDARRQAQRNKLYWQVSFRENNGIVEWAVHPTNINPNGKVWSQFDSNIQIDPETTAFSKDGARIFRFNYKGHPVPPLGRITLSIKNEDKAKRCVFVSTLLGTLRTSKEQDRPKDGKYCY